MPPDETMSQDTAFSTDKQESTFQFEVEKESPAASQAETTEVEETVEDTSPSSDENDVVEKKVPYSRFQTVVRERNEAAERISSLEERLSDLESARQETSSTSLEDLDVPPEWVKLYGDSDVSKEAWKIQQTREQQIAANAVRQALDMFKSEERFEREALVENEAIVEDSLASLQESVGKKFTKREEEAILSIVDEMSPEGEDGKYLSVFPFEKAYEIYELRNAVRGKPTQQARQDVARLTGNASEGESESQDPTFKRGWDNWREAL